MDATVQPSPTMQRLLRDEQVDVGGENAEMVDGPAVLGNCGVKMVGKGRSADVRCDEDDMRGQVAPVTCAKPAVASEDNGVKDGLGEAVQGGSGDDVGQTSVVTVGKGVDDVLAVGTGLVADEAISAEDEVAPVPAETAAVGEGGAGGADGCGADAADVIESGANVCRLGSNKMVAGRFVCLFVCSTVLQ